MSRITSGLLCGCALSALLAGIACANPVGGTVAQGAASITSSGSTLTVDQKTKIVIVNWNSFNIAQGETTRFNQPGSSATAVNRIGGADPAQILGNLSANGRLILIDGNGIVFGPNARVNAASLIATTSDAADSDLMSGKADFNKPGNPNARIVNQGHITASSGGMVGLIAPSVSNEGTIRARLGQVNLAGANVFTLDFNGDGLISFPADPSVVAAALDAHGKPVQALVANNGRIEGGTVTLTARAAAGLVENAISLKGKIVAQAAHEVGGKIVLDSGAGNVQMAGATLDASGKNGGGTVTAGGWNSSAVTADAATIIKANARANGDGGNISVIGQSVSLHGSIQTKGGSKSGNGGKVETSGHHADLNGITVSTAASHGQAGNWLIDPTDFTIAASGGDMTGATLSANLANGNVTILSSQGASGTDGNIVVNDTMSWSNHTLTLDAYNDINVNAVMSASGTGGFVGITGDTGGHGVSHGGHLNMGLADAGFTGKLNLAPTSSFTLNGNAYTIVSTLDDLQATDFNGSSVLGNDIDASATASWGSTFAPIGTGFSGGSSSNLFTGTLDGLGHVVRNLTINGTAQQASYVGLVGTTFPGAVIENIGVVGGSVSGSEFVGGLVGQNWGGAVRNSFTNLTVTGTYYVGGLVGEAFPDAFLPPLVISNSHANGEVVINGTDPTLASGGGLVGHVYGNAGYLAQISDSYATGNVIGTMVAGGLFGFAEGTTITRSYATGNVRATGSDFTGNGGGEAGGLGGAGSGTSIIESYATGTVTTAGTTGGLVGLMTGSISQSYATGNLVGITTGGLVGGGSASLSIDQSYASGAQANSTQRYGLAGPNTVITDSYWDVYSSGVATSGGNGGTAITSDPAQATASNYSFSAASYGNFSTGWTLIDGVRPLGSWEQSAVTSNGVTLVDNAHQLELIGTDALSLAKSYRLTRDLDLSGTNVAASSAGNYAGIWGAGGFAPIGSAASPFNGSFDGQGHAILGLTVDQGSSSGLFGYAATTSSVHDLGLAGGSVSGTGAAGMLAGYDAGSVSNVYATGVVNGATSVGGLLGIGDGATVSNAYASGAVSGGGNRGGLIGSASNTVITNGFFDSDAAFAGIGSGAGTVTALTTAQLRNGSLPTGFDSSIWGADAGFMPYLKGQAAVILTAPNLTVDATQAAQTAAVLNSGRNVILRSDSGDLTVSAPLAWAAGTLTLSSGASILFNSPSSISGTGNLNIATTSSSGDYKFSTLGAVTFTGAANDATGRLTINGIEFILENDVAGLAAATSGPLSHASFALTNDLDLTGTSYTTAPITGGLTAYGYYNGAYASYEGLGHTIANFTFNDTNPSSGYVGFFAQLNSGSSVRDLGFVGGSLQSDLNQPQNLKVSAGTLAAVTFDTTISHVFSTGTVNGGYWAGGLVGEMATSSIISDAFTTGNIYGNSAAGVVGIMVNGGTLIGVHSTGAISGQGAGGLVGSTGGGQTLIANSYSTGAISGVGGAGGLMAGGQNVTFSNVYASGPVQGSSWVGGLIGALFGGAITNGYATGMVTDTNATSVGGLVGFVDTGTFTNVFATGQVNVTGYGSTIYAGGLVGQGSNLRLTNGFSLGAIVGTGNVNTAGSLIGSASGTLTNVYATGAVVVNGTAHNALISHIGSLTLANAYLDSDTAGGPDGAAGVTNLTTPQLQGALPTGFDSSVWGTGAGLFSYLKSAFIGTPQSITGTATNADGSAAVAASITTYKGGAVLGTASTGTNGYYYQFVPAGTFASGNNSVGTALTLSGASTVSGATFSESIPLSTNSASQNVAAGTFAVTTRQGTSSAMSGDLSAAFGVANYAALTTALDSARLQIAAASDFTLDQALSRTGGIGLTAANITLAAPLTSQASGDAIVLAATGNFANSQGASALSAPNGRWLVYSAGVAGDSFGGLDSGNLAEWDTAAGAPIGDSGNRYVFAAKETFTVTTGDATKTYGDTPDLSGDYTIAAPGSTGVFLYGDPATLVTGAASITSVGASGNASVASSPYAVTATLGTLSAPSYTTLTFSNTGLLTVNPAALTVTYTADPASSIYGTGPSGLTGNVSSAGLVNNDSLASVVTGSAGWTTSASATSNVGSYGITGGGLSANSTNYNITFVQAASNATALTISPASLTVTYTANLASGSYGTTPTGLSGNVSGLGLVNNDSLASVLTGTAGWSTSASGTSGVGTYAITGSGLSANTSNYSVSFAQGLGNTSAYSVTAAPLTLTYTANTASSVYGSAVSGLTGSVAGSGFVNGEGLANLTGAASWTTTASQTTGVGTYAVTGSGYGSGNYAITVNQAPGNAGALSITARPLTITADTKTSIYGGAVPALSYGVGATDANSGLVNGDTLSGSLETTGSSSSSVGSYAITQGTLSAGGNYSLNYTGANLAITPATLMVAADAKSKVYGQADPILTYGVTGLVNNDTASVFSGSLSRTAGENVGSYAIGAGDLSAGGNYTISYAGANLAINPATLLVAAGAKTKVYGQADPVLSYGVTGLANGDTAAIFIGALSRTAGENVGSYAVGQGDLSAGSNYTISYTGADLAITPATLTVAADAKTKVYGGTDPTLTYGVSGFVNNDSNTILSGGLTRATGENAGAYAIGLGSLSAGANYTIAYSDANLTITPASLSVAADAQSKIYGQADPAFTYQASGFANGDNGSVFTGSLSRAAGQDVGAYGITVGTLSAGGNYAITYTGANLAITPAPLIVAADSQIKVYGSVDPALSYQASGLVNGDTNSVFSGALARAPGEAVAGGPYAISQGTLSAGGNYTISYTGANLTINPATLFVAANGVSKVYGGSDPTLTYGAAGFVNGDSAALLSGSLTRIAGENVGTYAIGEGSLTAGSNYAINYSGANLAITPASLTVTANAQNKVYGQIDPSFTFGVSGFVNSDTSAILTGGLSRAAGENVGSYGITVGSLSAGGNYTISYAGANLAITPATLVVAADAKTKVYGQADPVLTFGVTGLVNNDTNSVFSGSLSRTTGENVGSYAIGAGDLSAGGNYTISFTGANLAIIPATLFVAADAKSKVYGQADPALTFGATGLVNGDSASVVTGSLVRTAGENTGSYAIGEGSLSAGGNYTISYTGANLAITPATLSVGADAQTKVYGQADPSFTYGITGFVNGDTDSIVSGALARTAGEDVGAYAIGQGNLSAGGNYSISYTGANLLITPATLSVAANAQSKIYGQADPAFTYQASGFVNGDTASVFTGSLARAAGQNVGTYGITLGTVSGGSNYAISYTGASLAITPAPLTVAADSQTKIYGTADPVFTYQAAGLVNGDTSSVFSGALARTAGEIVTGAPYTITQGTLSAGGNYTVSYVGAGLSITPATLTVSANPVSKVYGAADPALSFAASGFANGDTAAVLNGSLVRAAGENVGAYDIGAGSLSAGPNYTIAYNAANLSITPATLSVTANAQTKVYGQSDPTLSYGAIGFVNGDTSGVLSGALSRSAGENVGNYAIGQGSLSAGGNYAISYTGANLAITPAALSVAADAQSKVYGQADPALSYQVSGLVNGDTLSIFGGALARTAGENVGSYGITQGSLSGGSNYVISYTGAILAITPAALTVAANAESKVYGQADPVLTYQVSGLVNGDASSTFSGTLSRAAGETVAGGPYAINQGSLSAGSNYTFSFTGANLAITPAPLTVAYRANPAGSVYGSAPAPASGSVDAVGLVNGDSLGTVTTGTAGWSTPASALSTVGSYAINGSGLSANSANYNVTFAQAAGNATAYSVSPAALTLTYTANSVTSVYGSSIPTLTGTVSGSGFVNGEGLANLSGAASWATAATSTSGVGSYAITGAGYSSGNYTITANQAPANANALSITARPLTVAANAETGVYGAGLPALTYAVGTTTANSGLVNGDTLSGALTTTATAGSPVGTYVITQGTLAASPNYMLSFAGANLSITPAVLSVIANPQTKTYGASDPSLTYSIAGLVNGDTASSLTGNLARTNGENVGSYGIGQGTLSAGINYTVSYNGANLTIIPATLMVAAAPKTKVYGQSDPALTYSVSGFVNGDTSTIVNGALVRASGQNVGSYAIGQGTLAAGGNYTISYSGADLAITPAALAITAAAESKAYGQRDPILAFTADGFVNGDTSAALSGALSRDTGQNPGQYAITIGTLANPNYSITFTGATLTITAPASTTLANTPGYANSLIADFGDKLAAFWREFSPMPSLDVLPKLDDELACLISGACGRPVQTTGGESSLKLADRRDRANHQE